MGLLKRLFTRKTRTPSRTPQRRGILARFRGTKTPSRSPVRSPSRSPVRSPVRTQSVNQNFLNNLANVLQNQPPLINVSNVPTVKKPNKNMFAGLPRVNVERSPPRPVRRAPPPPLITMAKNVRTGTTKNIFAHLPPVTIQPSHWNRLIALEKRIGTPPRPSRLPPPPPNYRRRRTSSGNTVFNF